MSNNGLSPYDLIEKENVTGTKIHRKSPIDNVLETEAIAVDMITANENSHILVVDELLSKEINGADREKECVPEFSTSTKNKSTGPDNVAAFKFGDIKNDNRIDDILAKMDEIDFEF